MSAAPTRLQVGGLSLERRTIDVCGLPAHMLVAGEGPTLLLWVPALMDSAAGFGRVTLPLARRLEGIARVGAIDPPGYGESSRAVPDRTPSFAELGSWLLEVVRQTPGPLILAGCSSGCVPATAAAARASKVALLILVGWCDWRLIGPPHTELLYPADDAQLDHLLRLGWHEPPRLPRRVREDYLARSRSLDFQRHVRSFDPEEYGRDLDDYDGSLALVAGLSDRIIAPEMIEALARSRPEACVEWIDHCGHYPHKEQPKRLAEILEDLVTRRGEVARTQPSALRKF